MKILTKLILPATLMLACFASIYLLQQKPSSVYIYSSEEYFIYQIPSIPVYKGSKTNVVATPAVPPMPELSSISGGKTSNLSMYENVDVIVPVVNFNSSKSTGQSAGQAASGMYAYGRASSRGENSSGSYGFTGSSSKPNASVELLYLDSNSPKDPVDPDNVRREKAPGTLPIGNGVWTLLLLAAGYILTKRLRNCFDS